jgi:uncharacterized iron-regulated protein
MKSILKLLSCLIALNCSSNLVAQTFESDCLPIGDRYKKYELCPVSVDQIINTHTNKESSFEEMIDILKQKRIVMIGESHTNQLHHDLQLKIIKGLVESGKPVVLALEMYNPSQNDKLADWISGKTDPNSFLEQTGYLSTWGHNYRYYKAIFDYTRDQHLPIYGANVDRKYASKIGKGGLESLSHDEIQLLPHIDTSNVEHRFLINILMEGMGASMPQFFKNMYPAQCLWDCAMGTGAIEVAHRHPEATVVLLAGSGHVIYNLGIGRIIKNQSNLSFASVVPVDIETSNEEEKENIAHGMGMGQGSPNRIVARSYGDFLWGLTEMEQDLYPSLGITLRESTEKGFPIKSIFPGTIAYENGLRSGDVLMAINGKTFNDLFSIKKFLQFVNWDDTLNFKIMREQETKEIKCSIQPID